MYMFILKFYVYLCVFVRMRIFAYVCMHVCMYVCMYACVYLCVCIDTSFFCTETKRYRCLRMSKGCSPIRS